MTINTIDCRGLQCPEPVLRAARAAKQLSESGGTFEILADDEAFPSDVQSWCRSSGATLVTLEPRGGAHRAVVRVQARERAVARDVLIHRLDLRGKVCPEPVLAIARHARTHEGPVEVLADDDAFGPDVTAWCKSAGANLVELTREGAVYRARIEVPRVVARGLATPPPPPLSALSAPSWLPPTPPTPPTRERASLDCRGMQCPEPILALARHARAHAGEEVEIVADDAAFASDIAAWTRSAGAAELSRTQEGQALRVRLRLAGSPASGRAPSSAVVDVPPRAASAVAPNAGAGPLARFDLSRQSPRQAIAESERIAGLGSGMTVELTLPDEATAQATLRFFAGAGHDVLQVDMGTPSRVTFRLAEGRSLALVPATAPSPTEAAPSCTLLVLHNDLEVLLAALIVANGAAAAGMNVMIFFTFWGLNALRGDEPNLAVERGKTNFFQRVFKWLMPKGARKQKLGQLNFGGAGSAILGSIMRDQRVAELPALMTSASELGVRFVACTMSMNVMGITKRDLHPYPNLELAGVATFVDAAKSSKLSLVF